MSLETGTSITPDASGLSEKLKVVWRKLSESEGFKKLSQSEQEKMLQRFIKDSTTITDETESELEFTRQRTVLENATLSLHTDNALDPTEKIEAAKKALLTIKQSPEYSKIALAGGIEQKTPETQKVAELEGAIKRSENKDALCRSFSQKIQGKGEIEYWDPDWITLNDDKTSIAVNLNWGGDAHILGSGDDCAGFTMQEAFDIFSANKAFFEKGTRITATSQKKPEGDTEKTPEASIKYLEEWSQERDLASGRRKVLDANGGDYEKTGEVGNWEYPDKYAHVDFLEGMMKDFDDGADYNSNQQNLAKTGVEKTGKRLGEVKNYLTDLKTMMDGESDPVKKTSLQKSYDDIEVKYRFDQKKYVTISANLGNSYEEQEEFINIELAVKNATEYVQGAKNADDAIRYLHNMHITILNNFGQSGKAKETYKAVTQAVGKTIFEKIQNDTTLTQESKNEKMVALARLVSQRETDIDNDVQDSALAIDVLEKVLSMPDAAIGYMRKQGKPSPLAREVESKKKEVLPALQGIENDAKSTGTDVPSIVTPEQKKIIESTPKTLDDIAAQYSLLCFLEIAVKNIEIAKRRSGTPPSNEGYITLNQAELQDEINKSMVPYIEEGTKGLYMQLDQSGNNTLAKFQEFTGLQLTVEQQKAYTLLHDIKGLGWWNTSDATNASLVQGAKIAGMIAVGIAAGIATGGAGFVAYASAGAAMTAAECVIFNKAMGVKETVTTTAINTAGMALGGALSGTKSAGIGAQAVGAGLARAGSIGKAALKVGGALDDVVARGAGVITKVPGVQKGLTALRSMDEAGGAKALASEAIQSGVDYSSGAVMEGVRQQVMEGKGAEEAFLAALSDPTSLAMIGVPIGMRLSPKGVAFVKKTFQGQNSESVLKGLEDGTLVLPKDAFEGIIENHIRLKGASDPDTTRLLQIYRNQHESTHITFPHPHLQNTSLADMKKGLIGLSRDEKRIRIQEIREIVQYSQDTSVKIIQNIESGLEEAILTGSRLNLRSTSGFLQAIDLAKTLPREYKNAFAKKLSVFNDANMLRASLEGLPPHDIVKKIFNFDPEGNIGAKIGPFSTELDIAEFEDFLKIATHGDSAEDMTNLNLEREKETLGIAGLTSTGHVAVTRKPKDVSIIGHETQHARFSAIAPTAPPHMETHYVSQKLSEGQINTLLQCPKNTLDENIKSILKPELQKALVRVQDEALAFTKNEFGHGHNALLEKGKDASYDYTFELRENIIHMIESRKDITPQDKNTLTIKINTGFMDEYSRVTNNILYTAQMNPDKLDLLAITPYEQWGRLKGIILQGKKSDYTLNLLNESSRGVLEDKTSSLIVPKDVQKPSSSDIQSGNLLPQIQSEISAANDGDFGPVRKKWAENIIHTLRGNETPLSPQELQAIQDAHTIPATGPDGKYTPSDIAKKVRKLEEAFPGSEGKNIREALIRNGVCGEPNGVNPITPETVNIDPNSLDPVKLKQGGYVDEINRELGGLDPDKDTSKYFTVVSQWLRRIVVTKNPDFDFEYGYLPGIPDIYNACLIKPSGPDGAYMPADIKKMRKILDEIDYPIIVKLREDIWENIILRGRRARNNIEEQKNSLIKEREVYQWIYEDVWNEMRDPAVQDMLKISGKDDILRFFQTRLAEKYSGGPVDDSQLDEAMRTIPGIHKFNAELKYFIEGYKKNHVLYKTFQDNREKMYEYLRDLFKERYETYDEQYFPSITCNIDPAGVLCFFSPDLGKLSESMFGGAGGLSTGDVVFVASDGSRKLNTTIHELRHKKNFFLKNTLSRGMEDMEGSEYRKKLGRLKDELIAQTEGRSSVLKMSGKYLDGYINEYIKSARFDNDMATNFRNEALEMVGIYTILHAERPDLKPIFLAYDLSPKTMIAKLRQHGLDIKKILRENGLGDKNSIATTEEIATYLVKRDSAMPDYIRNASLSDTLKVDFSNTRQLFEQSNYPMGMVDELLNIFMTHDQNDIKGMLSLLGDMLFSQGGCDIEVLLRLAHLYPENLQDTLTAGNYGNMRDGFYAAVYGLSDINKNDWYNFSEHFDVIRNIFGLATHDHWVIMKMVDLNNNANTLRDRIQNYAYSSDGVIRRLRDRGLDSVTSQEVEQVMKDIQKPNPFQPYNQLKSIDQISMDTFEKEIRIIREKQSLNSTIKNPDDT